MGLVGIGAVVALAIAAPMIEWAWRHRIDRARHKAKYPMTDRYPPPQASPSERWPWV